MLHKQPPLQPRAQIQVLGRPEATHKIPMGILVLRARWLALALAPREALWVVAALVQIYVPTRGKLQLPHHHRSRPGKIVPRMAQTFNGTPPAVSGRRRRRPLAMLANKLAPARIFHCPPARRGHLIGQIDAPSRTSNSRPSHHRRVIVVPPRRAMVAQTCSVTLV